MPEDHEFSAFANPPHVGGGGTFSNIGGNRYQVEDERTLARLGKKQVLKVCLDPRISVILLAHPYPRDVLVSYHYLVLAVPS